MLKDVLDNYCVTRHSDTMSKLCLNNFGKELPWGNTFQHCLPWKVGRENFQKGSVLFTKHTKSKACKALLITTREAEFCWLPPRPSKYSECESLRYLWHC